MFLYTPHKNFLIKLLLIVALCGLIAFLTLYIPMYFAMQDNRVQNYAMKSLLWALLPNLLWFIPTFLTMFPLYKTFRYELMDDEIVVSSGYIVNKVRHVPYRMVTNLELRRGLLDRLLGIGTLSIETAGKSSSDGRSEAVLAGLAEVQQVYEEVAECLRNYTENHHDTYNRSQKVAIGSDSTRTTLEAILTELKTISQKI